MSKGTQKIASASFRDTVLTVFWIVAKFVLFIRYGYDTYTVAMSYGETMAVALLDVAMIDMIMVAAWMFSAYGGTSKRALSLRPISALIAWTIYLLTLPIAWKSGQYIAIMARVAGVGMLLQDTGSVIADIWRNAAASHKSVTYEERFERWKAKFLYRIHKRRYKRAVRRKLPKFMVKMSAKQATLDIQEMYSEEVVVLIANDGIKSTPKVLPSPDMVTLPAGKRILDTNGHKDLRTVDGVVILGCKACNRKIGQYDTAFQANRGWGPHVRSKEHQDNLDTRKKLTD